MDKVNLAGFLVNLCLIIVLSIVITGCLPTIESKPDVGGLSTIVEGRVIDFYTQEGIKGVPVVISDEDSEALPWEWSDTYYDTIYTDSIGYYRYAFLNEIGRDYYVLPQSTELYYNQHCGRLILEGKLNTYSPLYKPYRLLNIHIVNNLKKWTYLYYWNPIGEYTIPQHSQFNGFEVDTIFLMKFVPDQDIGLNFIKSNRADNIDENFQINFNYENKDTSICIDY